MINEKHANDDTVMLDEEVARKDQSMPPVQLPPVVDVMAQIVAEREANKMTYWREVLQRKWIHR